MILDPDLIISDSDDGADILAGPSSQDLRPRKKLRLANVESESSPDASSLASRSTASSPGTQSCSPLIQSAEHRSFPPRLEPTLDHLRYAYIYNSRKKPVQDNFVSLIPPTLSQITRQAKSSRRRQTLQTSSTIYGTVVQQSPYITASALQELPVRNTKKKHFTSNGNAQAGAERPYEFQTTLHSLLNRPGRNRSDNLRADIFAAYIAETSSREEPDAPPIVVLPHFREAAPEFSFVFTSRIVYQPGSSIVQSAGCDCKDGCQPGNLSCSCFRRQSEENRKHGLPPSFAYNKKGRLAFDYDEQAPIWECNDRCGCPPDCVNRVVGRGRRLPLQLVRTPNCGWGVRINKLPHTLKGRPKSLAPGTFIGVYSGELISTKEARRRDQLYNDVNQSYLFDLDFTSIGKIESLKTFGDDGICYLGSSNRPSTYNMTAWPEPSSATPLDRRKPMEVNTFDAFHSVDAFHVGGVTRFINHNCQPNCILRCCYVNEADPTKPLLAIFTVKPVRSFDELSISYNGDLNLDDELENLLLNMPASRAVATGKAKAGKKRKAVERVVAEKRTCWCNAPICSGRMFRDETDSEDEDDILVAK